MKTVFMICPFAKPNVGGVESHLDKLTGYLSAKGYRVILVTYKPLTTRTKARGYEKKGGVEIYRARWFGVGLFPRLEPYFPLVFLYLFPGLFFKSLLVYMRRRKEVDTVHAHGFVAAAVARVILAFSRRRSVVSTHAIYNLRNRRFLAGIIRRLLNGFDTILAVGEPSRRELVAIGLDPERIKVHPNWIDIKTFNPMDKDECRRTLKISPEHFVVLFLGRMMEMKGVGVLLEAARRTRKDIRFVFVGDGPMAGAVKEAARTDLKINYLGRLPDDGIIRAYNSADLFVSPVLYEEGFATVYLESLACGTPVITAKRGCLPFFLNWEVADLMEEVNPEKVLDRIEFYFDNREELQKRRHVCRSYAEKNFSEKNADIIAGSY